MSKTTKDQKTLDEMTSADYYFDSYSHFGIHEEMLKDEVRTRSYMNSMIQNPHVFKDKIVLDVGCGTGILSMFASKAGAKHVYGIDMSKVAEKAKHIVKVNGFEDKVTIIRGKVEDIDLPVEKVDIIISEWMGYCLFYESMLDTVLFARDKWLVDGGKIFPDKCQLFAVAIEDESYREEKIDFWDNVYGFDMSIFREGALTEPLVDVVPSSQIITKPALIIDVDIETVKKEDLAFKKSIRLEAQRADFVHAIVTYFDIQFTHCHKPVEFSTGPYTTPTHWQQTVFYIDDVVPMKEGEGIDVEFDCKPNAKNPRDLDFIVEYKFEGEAGKLSSKRQYHMR
eukprot:TRINITY_DN5055_c0_g1_i1.p1 TRINITY_DN5055_c0_g1~~TRINITY_DN5055_c0_g1_i1.p1  ORF type:complete len:353 (+),score=85.58 TRINITY_DN5055_c0_g1_i1:44-1060(+)